MLSKKYILDLLIPVICEMTKDRDMMKIAMFMLPSIRGKIEKNIAQVYQTNDEDEAHEKGKYLDTLTEDQLRQLITFVLVESLGVIESLIFDFKQGIEEKSPSDIVGEYLDYNS